MHKDLEFLGRMAAEIIPAEDLVAKLAKSRATGKPLRIKYGIDPTGRDVHIGHLVPIRVMRRFQDLGHTGVIIIGDYTARIGDPTGRDATRPPLTPEQVEENASTYMEQLFTVLDPARTEVRKQSEWFNPWNLQTVLKVLSRFTLAQFMAHDTFRKRWEDGQPLSMHEIMYPVLQGYDSVAIEADVELGATEQKFNILCGRDMQRWWNQPEQVAVLTPILTGLDGVNKMGKSLGNYVGVKDAPNDKYGKIMSIPDSLIRDYFIYAADVSNEELAQVEAELASGANPKFIKQRLAKKVTAWFHGEDAAQAAEDDFNAKFSQKEFPADAPVFCYKNTTTPLAVLMESGSSKSNSEARRLVQQGGFSVDGEKITDPYQELSSAADMQVKAGKRLFLVLHREAD